MYANGYEAMEIAHKLGIARSTVHSHMHRGTSMSGGILERLGAKSVPHAVAIALRNGLIL